MSAVSPAPFRWGLIGPGRIAHRFAEAVAGLPQTQLVAVCGRDAQRAGDFAQRWPGPRGERPRVHTEVADLLAQGGLDGVYIATPHAQHLAPALACLQAGVAVLCEKSLVSNAAQGRTLVAAAQAHGSFLMEAVWTRFLPLYETLGDWLREGRLGALQAIQSSFCFPAAYEPSSRLFDPAQAGGALLDLGIYNLSMTRWALQHSLGELPPLRDLRVSARLAPTGVDQRLAVSLDFGAGLVSQFVCALDGSAPNQLQLLGEHASLVVEEPFWGGVRASLRRRHEPPEWLERPLAINGFEGEILEAMRCVRTGLIESPRMPHAESLAVLGWMDQIRALAGVRYPFE